MLGTNMKIRSCILILNKIGAKQRALDIKTCVMMTISSITSSWLPLLQRLQSLLSCKIYPVVVYDIKIDVHVTVNNSKLLFVVSILATCFDSTDRPQAFKYVILNSTYNA
jgi:hypothetical protein